MPLLPKRLALPCALAFAVACQSTDDDPGSLPPSALDMTLIVAPVIDDPLDSAAIARTLRAQNAADLAYSKPVRASHVRGNHARFTPSALTDANTATYWSTDDFVTSADATVEFGEPTSFDHVLLAEHPDFGERVGAWTLSVRAGGDWRDVARGSGIGAVRVVRFERATGDALRLSIDDAIGCPALSAIEVYAHSD